MLLEQDPLPPRLLNPKLDRDLEMIVLKCLQKPPELRYESAAALAGDLAAYLNDEPIAARSGQFSQVVARVFRANTWLDQSVSLLNFTAPFSEQLPAKLRKLPLHFGTGPLGDGQHRDHRGHPEDEPKSGEQYAQLVKRQIADGKFDDVPDPVHGDRSPVSSEAS